MNKCQKALDHIYGFLETYDEQIDKDYETLKELIDKNKMLEKFDKALFFNSNGFVVEGISYTQLERALDKASAIIENINFQKCPPTIKESEECKHKKCKECWKEWLLHE